MRLRRFVLWMRRRVWWLIGIAVLGVTLDRFVPSQHLPWRTLNLNHPIGLATGTKLAALNLVPRSWCAVTVSDARHLQIASVAPKRESDNCGWSHAYQLIRSHETVMRGNGQYPMNCPLVAATHLWVRELQVYANQILGKPVTQIHHAGTYSCRRKYGQRTGSLSEHAYANAWDVTGFELSDGSVVSVKKHWSDPGARGRFLHAVRDRGCSLFNVVLSPDYNAAHHDHLHLDMGPFISCQ